MELATIDWIFIVLFFVISLGIGIYASRTAGKNTSEFFLSGRNMPWWLLGVSMVATTFSADTPNLVADIVRQNGVAGNWVWWAFLLTGMLTVFVYAKLWRRSKVMTDLEFYEIRYSGKGAAFLRGFRAIYLGIFFNVMIMATVSLAAIKMGGVMLNLTPVQTVLIASVVTVAYASLGGLKGVLLTDFFQFFIAMIGAVGAAIVALNLPEVGGINGLLEHKQVVTKLNIIPDFSDTNLLLTVFILPLAVQWWSVWYPGAEPGGGGYIAQRMLSAKNEKNAIGATLLFNAAHYALRPWPWIIVALCSIIVYPNLESLQQAFPHVSESVVRNDLAYPAMLTFLPAGLLGLVIASLVAAFMSTISTHLNWGSSYVVNDFYKRFVDPGANEKKLVAVARLSTLTLMVLSALFALVLENALQAFQILLQIGAGTGLIFILRWFWWRINAYTEISAMIISFVVAIYFQVIHTKLGFDPIPAHIQLVSAVGITTVGWLIVTLLTKPDSEEKLIGFYKLVSPGGPGWKKIVDSARVKGEEIDKDEGEWQVPMEILAMIIGCFTVYSALFATGYWIYGRTGLASILSIIAVAGIYVLMRFWKKIRTKED